MVSSCLAVGSDAPLTCLTTSLGSGWCAGRRHGKPHMSYLPLYLHKPTYGLPVVNNDQLMRWSWKENEARVSGRQCLFRRHLEGAGAGFELMPRPTSERCLLIMQPPVHGEQSECGGSFPLLQRLGMFARSCQYPGNHGSDLCA